MLAPAIVERAKRADLDMIGICDHNSGENVAAVVKAGARSGLAVIPGMEVTSSEEVHILGLFDSEADLMDLQETVYQNLPGENSEEAFGPQLVADEWGNIVEKNHRLLIGATTLTVDQVVDAIHRRSGLAIASHVDRERFSLIGQLGFVPEGLELDALEVSDPSRTVITSSDAHFLEDVGKSLTSFEIEDASLSEIGKALRHELGRRIVAN
jgi:predicted metal-dependent phosphoesterase TrpH